MNRRRTRRLFLATSGALAGAAAMRPPFASAEAYTMRLSTVTDAASVEGLAVVSFASAVHRRSGGQLTIEIYPNSQIAKESEVVNGLINGVIDFCATASTILLPVAPRFQIFNLPFLFKNLASAYRVLDGTIGNELFDDIEAKGILGLNWGDGGFRELHTNRVVNTVEDMKGLRLRVQGDPISFATYQALGTIPVSIEPAEILVALQQHTIDGTDLTLDSIVSHKYYVGPAKHMAMLHQMLGVLLFVASKRKFEGLPVALQRIVREEAKAVQAPWRAGIIKQTAEEVQVLKQNGVTFNEPQAAAFRRAVEPAYALVQGKLGASYLERVGRFANG